jgi:hypothetical protein
LAGPIFNFAHACPISLSCFSAFCLSGHGKNIQDHKARQADRSISLLSFSSCFRDSNPKVNAKLGSEGVLVEVDELNPTMRAGEEGWFRPSKFQILQ